MPSTGVCIGAAGSFVLGLFFGASILGATMMVTRGYALIFTIPLAAFLAVRLYRNSRLRLAWKSFDIALCLPTIVVGPFVGVREIAPDLRDYHQISALIDSRDSEGLVRRLEISTKPGEQKRILDALVQYGAPRVPKRIYSDLASGNDFDFLQDRLDYLRKFAGRSGDAEVARLMETTENPALLALLLQRVYPPNQSLTGLSASATGRLQQLRKQKILTLGPKTVWGEYIGPANAFGTSKWSWNFKFCDVSGQETVFTSETVEFHPKNDSTHFYQSHAPQQIHLVVPALGCREANDQLYGSEAGTHYAYYDGTVVETSLIPAAKPAP